MAETETDEVNTTRSFTTYQVTPPSKFSFKFSEWTRWIRRFESDSELPQNSTRKRKLNRSTR